MADVLIVAKSNSYGLTRDMALFKAELEAIGKSVETVSPRERQFLDRLSRRKRAKTVVHMERAFPQWYSAGERNWLIPNQERFPKRQLGRLAGVDLVLAKSRHGEAVFAARSVATEFLGFISEDRRARDIGKEWSRFFHLAGGSAVKGTEDVIGLWTKHPEWPELVIVQKDKDLATARPTNIRIVSGYLDDAELKRLQNSCGVHLCPSRSEGWGHHIVEGLSVGAVLVTTDAPPMNEHVTPETGLTVAHARCEPRHLGTNFFVDPVALETAISELVRMDDASKAKLGAAARERYQAMMVGFRQRLAALPW